MDHADAIIARAASRIVAGANDAAFRAQARRALSSAARAAGPSVQGRARRIGPRGRGERGER